ncbi:DNA translocase FtsK [Rubellicoccus peritrichatus]|uniref:DNA translocase FtsK n=1 Tax=Rubellicoccus peritrichatus TaxID=3080537 RepID=A0AAQ3LB73_9BACT|nr:DNA translocase FtsK [Puniceicoccus sp. CR14]WOO42884.1 DNA translocase FtsK [Puniceicoccus sp. CR14]
MFGSLTASVSGLGVRSRLKRLVQAFGNEEDAEHNPEEIEEENLEASTENAREIVAEEVEDEGPFRSAEEAEAAWMQEWEKLEGWQQSLDERLSERMHRKAGHAYLIAQSHAKVEAFLAMPSEASEAEELTEAPAEEAVEIEVEPKPVIPAYTQDDTEGYQLPSLDFLHDVVEGGKVMVPEKELAEQSRELQQTLDNFAVDALVCDAVVGPRVTQHRVKPGFGVRVESISSLENNIALSLAVNAVRIQAPIPGEPFVGVEAPNRTSRPIMLKEAFESPAWTQSSATLPLVLGMDITGNIQICDLAKAPHMLIAGATGSGKSVCINNLILSLLYRFRPGELELVLVDPKRVEFAMYRELPHLIHPVVGDAKEACQALKWLVREMENRYDEMADKRVRNIAGYNEKAKAEGFKPLSYIVLIIDELADLMMTAKDDVETPIARLAQMSRAVGIHTVLATQRPSVNVITGVIKANFPTRAAFQVSSQIDSRTILDGKGAESLQGKGDMLYNPPGQARLLRLQSPFVDDDEIIAITDSLRAQLEPRYRVELQAEDAPGGSNLNTEDMDPMLKDALAVVATTGKASTSFIQRRLKIGYNRAANLVEELEVRGYIGPQIGTNPREIFVEPGSISL